MVGSPRRRRWGNVLIAIGTLVLLCTAVTAYLLPVQYEAFALVNVRRNEPTVLSKAGTSNEEFDVYKRTQVQLMLSTNVLNGVLRNSDINQLSIVQEHMHDPVDWLKEQLKIDYPDDAEVMRVAMKGADASDLVKIVDKVVHVYMKEIVEAAKLRRVAAEAKLRDAFDKETAEYTKKLRELNQLAAIHKGTAHFTTRLDATEQPVVVPKTDRGREAPVQIHVAERQLDALLVRQQEVARRIDENELQIRIHNAETEDKKKAEDESSAQTGADPPQAAKPEGASPLRALEVERDFLREQLAAVNENIRQKSKELAAADSVSAEVQVKQEELKSQREVIAQLRAELERLGIERLAEDRILVIDHAIVENEYGDAVPRYATFAGLAALGLSLVGLGLFIRRPAPFAHDAAIH
jgi:hypothetical protein